MSFSQNRRKGKNSYGGSYQSHSRSRRRRHREKLPLLLIIAAALIIIIAAVWFFKNPDKKGSVTQSLNEPETVNKDIIGINAYIDLGEVLPEGTAEDALIVSVKGMTPQEIVKLISEKYDWKLKITNSKADVGARVIQTVAADATTEAATMGDAENPDGMNSDNTEALSEDVSVSGSIEVPDFIQKALTELVDKIMADNEAAEKEKAAEILTETKAEKKGFFGKRKAEAQSEEVSEPDAEAENAKHYKLSLGEIDAEISDVVSSAASMWYVEPQGGSIGSYDNNSDTFVMEGEKSGFRVDEEKLKAELLDAIEEREYKKAIDVPGKVISPESNITVGDYKILASFTTKTTSNAVRNKNIQLACAAVNGTIIRPGEEFSFNNIVGQRTEEKGYGAAAAYNNGEVVQEVGGGVCQVSSTLYNAAVIAGLKITARQSHTFKPSYVTPGQDATISWGGPDFKFANLPAIAEYSNSETYAIGIRANYSNQTVTISIYGRPVLKEGYSYSLSSEQLKELDIVRELIQPGSDKTPTTGTKGSVWETRLVIKKNGEVISNSVDHKAYYAGHKEYYTDETSVSESESLIESESGIDESDNTSASGGPGGPGDNTSGVIGPDITMSTAADSTGDLSTGTAEDFPGPPATGSDDGYSSVGPGGTGGSIQDGPGTPNG